MKDMLEILRRAKQRKIFANQDEFKDILMQIQAVDTKLRVDWDDGSGEEWARLSNLMDGTVCMINTKIGVAFMKKRYNFKNIKHILEGFEVVFTEDYCSDDWFIDINSLEKEIPEIYWHVSENAVNRKCFSLDDFYFATV